VNDKDLIMNAPQQVAPQGDIEQQMQSILKTQREDYLKEGVVTAETRIDRLQRAVDVMVDYGDKLADALNADFTCRPREITLLTDVGAGIAPMKHAIKHVRSWMKPEKRPTMFPFNLLGGRSRIEYQPLGVVGVIAPWNFPVNMVFAPLAGVLAAGNRAMVKPSEFTPATSALIEEMIAKAFDPKEVACFNGGPEVGQAFSSLPFDHMIFTGATSIARHILAAASQNLVPVDFAKCGHPEEPGPDHGRQDHERRPDLPGAGLPVGAGGETGRGHRRGPEGRHQYVPESTGQPAIHLSHQRAPFRASQRLPRGGRGTRPETDSHQPGRGGL
jgi:hypothetical protein